MGGCGCKKKKIAVPVTQQKTVAAPRPTTKTDIEKKNLINRLLKIKI